jgi:hypothetical protein
MDTRAISDADMATFKQEIEEAEVNSQPLMSDSQPFEALFVEFESGNSAFLERLAVSP